MRSKKGTDYKHFRGNNGRFGALAVVEPHQDVATGEFQQAEFAADLAKVHNGSAPSEYRDPKEFLHAHANRRIKCPCQRSRKEIVSTVVIQLLNFKQTLVAVKHIQCWPFTIWQVGNSK